jgi:hypothetical protein
MKIRLSVTRCFESGTWARYDAEVDCEARTTMEAAEAHARTLLRVLDEQAFSQPEGDGEGEEAGA